MGASKKTRRLAMAGASAAAAAALVVTGAGIASAAPAAYTARTTTAHALAAAYSAPKRNLALGMKGSDVKALQERLAALKYYPGTSDGEFGGDTEAAVWAFQAINGIHQSGVVDAATKRALVHPRSYKPPRTEAGAPPGSRSTSTSRSSCTTRTTRSC